MMWFWLALATAILWGLTYTCTEVITKSVGINTYLTLSCLISTILYAAIGTYTGEIKRDLSGNNLYDVWPFLLTGFICSFVACYASVSAVKMGGASFASIVEISYPLWVILFTSLLNGRSQVNIQTVIGGIIIFVGTVFVVKSHG